PGAIPTRGQPSSHPPDPQVAGHVRHHAAGQYGAKPDRRSCYEQQASHVSSSCPSSGPLCTPAPWSAAIRGSSASWLVSSRVRLPNNHVHSMLNTVHSSRSAFKKGAHMGQRATPNTSATTASGAPTTDGRSPSLWF